MAGFAASGIANIEGTSYTGVEPSGSSYQVRPRGAVELAAENQPGLGKGTIGRRTVIVWGAAALWLFLVWRAVEGY